MLNLIVYDHSYKSPSAEVMNACSPSSWKRAIPSMETHADGPVFDKASQSGTFLGPNQLLLRQYILHLEKYFSSCRKRVQVVLAVVIFATCVVMSAVFYHTLCGRKKFVLVPMEFNYEISTNGKDIVAYNRDPVNV